MYRVIVFCVSLFLVSPCFAAGNLKDSKAGASVARIGENSKSGASVAGSQKDSKAATPVAENLILQPERLPMIQYFLPAPPSPGEGRFLNDSIVYFKGKEMRDTPRGELAIKDASLRLSYIMERFSSATGRALTEESYPNTAKFIEETCLICRYGILDAKNHYSRPRPYQHFNEHTPIPEDEEGHKNQSYPSGHTFRAWLVALCLVSIDEAHQNEILKTGYEVGQSRTIVGYHYQSDVDDARLAAGIMFARMVSVPAWQELRAAALKEFEAK